MNKNINEIDKKVIKFLLSAGVYSDLKEGYLETYEEYQKREKEECSSHSNCNTCSKSNSSCGSCCSKSQDYSNVKVITWKAIDEFQE